MAKAAGARPRQSKNASLAERLMSLLNAEVRKLERLIGPSGTVETDPEETWSSAGAKTRVEAISQVTRTLEKLLELRRLEALDARGAGEEHDRQETQRVAAELVRRLKALDRRRQDGAGLFSMEHGVAPA